MSVHVDVGARIQIRGPTFILQIHHKSMLRTLLILIIDLFLSSTTKTDVYGEKVDYRHCASSILLLFARRGRKIGFQTICNRTIIILSLVRLSRPLSPSPSCTPHTKSNYHISEIHRRCLGCSIYVSSSACQCSLCSPLVFFSLLFSSVACNANQKAFVCSCICLSLKD